MWISYDPEVDALSIIFRAATLTTRELAEGVAGAFDAVLELLDETWSFTDAEGTERRGEQQVRPRATIRAGRLVDT